MTNWMKRLGALMLGVLLIGEVGAAMSQIPLTGSTASVAPNLIFTLDNSTSMYYECVPDACSYAQTTPWREGGSQDLRLSYDPEHLYNRQLRSAAFNPIYYNPEVRYLPWLKANGERHPQYPADQAPLDPGLLSERKNLVSMQTVTARWYTRRGVENTTETAWPAQYHKLVSGTGWSTADYKQVIISPETDSYPKGIFRNDCAGSTCTYKEEAQNFSNWFTYARNRMKVAKGGTAEAFASVPSAFRVGFGVISAGGGVVDGVSNGTVMMGVRPFSSGRARFYDLLLGAGFVGGTPLRRAMDDVGQYFSRADSRSPWAADPELGESSAVHLSCRRSFHVLMTDGMWNDGPANTPGANQDVDNMDGPLITHANGTKTFLYKPVAPYRGASDPTLADVAMYYWSRDLRPDLKNDVPASDIDTPNSNPAYWQHLVNYTIGLGIKGHLDNPKDWPNLLAGTVGWGAPKNYDIANADDLWHAAVNSRGRSALANSVSEYTNALKLMVQTMVASGGGREAGIAVSGRSYAPTTVKYIPSYKPGDWTGEVEAQRLSDGSTLWSASKMLPASADRNIYTLKQEDSTGVPFTAAAMSAPTQAALGVADPAKLIGYVRGDRSDEQSTYRKRVSLLGDIVNSTPVLVKDLVDSQYDFLPDTMPGKSSYLRYLKSKKFRTPQLFVGANDGMLHAFNAESGTESFAFVPRSVMGRLRELANPAYDHKYFVDGPLTEADVYDTTASKWRNLVIGTGGAGAKNLFAINVPVPSVESGNPTALTAQQSAPGATDILWEINSDNPDYSELGHVLQAPEAGIMQDGTSVIITGNGYGSASGRSRLYVIDAQTGARIKVLSPALSSSSAGLGGVKLVRDANKRVVAAYAGDLLGFIWKFDFSSADRSEWGVAFSNNPFFNASNSEGKPEPITAAPTVLPHPLGGVMVLAGTGKLFESDDASSTSEQSLYGIWDKAPLGGVVSAADFVTQTITPLTINGSTGEYFAISSNSVDYGTGSAAKKRGWKIRMTIAPGQRQIYSPQIESGRVLFDTMVPGGTATGCTATQPQGYTFVLDPFTGAPSQDGPTFDTSNDGSFTAADNVTAAVTHFSSIGQRRIVRVPGSSEVRLEGPGTPGSPLGADSTKKVKLGGTPVKRQWRQIISPPSY